MVHRDLQQLRTGGSYYLANTIWYLRKRNVNVEVIDFGALPARIRKNRILLAIYLCKFFLGYKKHVFTFTNHNLYFYLLIPLLVNRAKGNRYGCACHLSQYVMRRNFFMKWFEFLCEFLFLQGASIIIVPSKSALQQFKVFHIKRKKKVIINPAPNIVNQGNAVFRKKARRLLFVGNIEPRKGLDVLLTALGSLKDRNLHLDVAGFFNAKSDYFKEIKRIMAINKLEKNVSFHGLLNPETLVSLYQKADIFVFPSRHETYGMVLVEAMSFGLPVIASAIPTTIAIVKHDVNGILYETENCEALANAIRKLTSDSRFRRKIMLNNITNKENLRTWNDVGEDNLRALTPFLQR